MDARTYKHRIREAIERRIKHHQTDEVILGDDFRAALIRRLHGGGWIYFKHNDADQDAKVISYYAYENRFLEREWNKVKGLA